MIETNRANALGKGKKVIPNGRRVGRGGGRGRVRRGVRREGGGGEDKFSSGTALGLTPLTTRKSVRVIPIFWEGRSQHLCAR